MKNKKKKMILERKKIILGYIIMLNCYWQSIHGHIQENGLQKQTHKF